MEVMEAIYSTIKENSADYRTAISSNYRGTTFLREDKVPLVYHIIQKFLEDKETLGMFVNETDKGFNVDNIGIFEYFCDWLTELK